MTEIRRQYVITQQGQVLVRRGGTGDVVVVLHHTYGSSESALRGDFLPRLGDHFAVFAPDTIGQGQSDLPPHQLTVAEYAENAKDVLDALGLERASFIGHHTGASIALEFAAVNPERVNRLIFSGLPMWTAAEREAKRTSGGYRPYAFDPGGQYLHDLWQRRLAITHGLNPDQKHWQFLEFLRPGPRVHEPLQALFRYEPRERLPLVNAPTLALSALSDGFAGQVDEIVALMPNAEPAIVADGTLFHNLDPDAFLATAVSFLA